MAREFLQRVYSPKHYLRFVVAVVVDIQLGVDRRQLGLVARKPELSFLVALALCHQVVEVGD